MASDNELKIKQAIDKIQKVVSNPELAFNRQAYQQLGDTVISEMKDLISKGISPIEGQGRFPAYKRAGEKGKYPDRFKSKGKRARPVNLTLTGEFLRSLKLKIKSNGVEVGYFSEDQAVKEEGHRDGANSQPKRPTIPLQSESFARKIQLKIDNFIQDVVAKYLDKLNL